MPEPSSHADRTPAQREADHAALARLSETLLPALVQKLNASGLGELEVREGGWRVRLRRPAGAAAAVPAPRRTDRHRLAGHGPERDPRAHDPGRDAPAEAQATADEPPRAVATSPAVGIFRPTASLGTRLEAGDRLGTVDLLGIAQDVVAPVDGTLAEILVAAGDAVEYGEPVAAVDVDPPALAAPDPDEEG
jgi:biotin carboxyl carrier protein